MCHNVHPFSFCILYLGDTHGNTFVKGRQIYFGVRTWHVHDVPFETIIDASGEGEGLQFGAVLHAQTGLVTKEHLELAVMKPDSSISFALRNDAEDKERILRALKQANGNRKVAAELLGIGRTTLYGKLEEHGLRYKCLVPMFFHRFSLILVFLYYLCIG